MKAPLRTVIASVAMIVGGLVVRNIVYSTREGFDLKSIPFSQEFPEALLLFVASFLLVRWAARAVLTSLAKSVAVASAVAVPAVWLLAPVAPSLLLTTAFSIHAPLMNKITSILPSFLPSLLLASGAIAAVIKRRSTKNAL